MKSKDKVLAKELRDLKNVGKATLADLHLLGIYSVKELFHKMEKESGQRQDPCVWDVLAAIIHEAKTGERTAWWEWTAQRKVLQKSGKLKHLI
jgi:nucleotidyltransferase/DNA polymerase involved in DNA repair